MRMYLYIGGPIILVLLVTLFLMHNGTIPSFGLFHVDQGTIEYRDGTDANYQGKMPGIPKYGNIQLHEVQPPTLSVPATVQH